MKSASIICTGCDYKTTVQYLPISIRYHTASGRSINTHREKGWCYFCGDYSDIESMNLKEFGEKLISTKQKRFEAQNSHDELSRDFFSFFRHFSEKRELQSKLAEYDEEIAKFGWLIEMMKRRKSKARCLKCWSDETAPLTFDSEDNVSHDFNHECGGNLKIIHHHSESTVRFFFSTTTYILNEDGKLLGKE